MIRLLHRKSVFHPALIALAFLHAGCPGGGTDTGGLKSLTLQPATVDLPPGTTRQLLAKGEFHDGRIENLTSVLVWTSSDETVAGVSDVFGEEGLVRAIARGQATITAEDPISGISATAQIVVSDAVLQALSIQPEQSDYPLGANWQFQAIGRFSDGSDVDVSAQASWSVNFPGVLEVSDAEGTRGQARAHSKGTATVSAAFLGFNAAKTVTVSDAVVESLRIAPASTNLRWGASKNLQAIGVYSDGSEADFTHLVQWSSTDPSTVDVSNLAPDQGMITGAFLTAEVGIAASFSSFTATATVSLGCHDPDFLVNGFSGGAGTAEDPYEICAPSDLLAIEGAPGSTHYRMLQDVDMRAYPLSGPIRPPKSHFLGVFDGNGFAIRNLQVESEVYGYGGLFRTLSGATIKNLRIIGARISAPELAGILAADARGQTTIENCHVEGTVTALTTGGMLGIIDGATAVSRSSVRGTASGEEHAGGFFGQAAESSWTLTDSYSLASVIGEAGAGGIVGLDVRANPPILPNVIRTYAAGSVTSTSNRGGLWGFGPNESFVITHSYWDSQATGADGTFGNAPNSVPSAKKSTSELMQQATFEDWDFADVWTIDEGLGYPTLQSEAIFD